MPNACCGISTGSGKSVSASSPQGGAGVAYPRPAEQGINAAKRSAVSTGQLRPLLALHTRPIDLVVFQEPVLHKAAGGLVLRRVSRLDAFSVYPGRTLATQRCRQRDNWNTRGSSLPILSY